MEKIVLTIASILIIFFGCEKIEVDDEVIIPDEEVNIPDKEFLRHLLSKGIDTNKDYKISHAEAEVVTYLDISNSAIYYYGSRIIDGIKSLKGIEAFINLDTLICYNASIENMDISKNTALIYLDCQLNHLTSLDASKNTALTYLNCQRNYLTSLDVSKNVALTFLECGNIEEDRWGRNALTSLDISKSTALKHININGMPTLYKVCVWTMPFPPEGVFVYNNYSWNVYFTTDCSNN